MKQTKPKKRKQPRISEKEAAELTQAVQFAFGNAAADDFVEKVLKEARRLQPFFAEREAQSRTQ